MRDDAEIIALREATDISLGHPFRGSIRDVPGAGVGVVQLKNADPEYGVDWSALVRTNLTGRKDPDWLRPGDVLFSARGTRNVAVFLPDVPGHAVCAPQFFVLRAKHGRPIRPAYLAWFINQVPAQRYFAQSAEGSLVKSIRRQVLEDLQVPVPSVQHQELIAKLANAVSRERKLTEELLQNRERQLRLVAQGLINHVQEGHQQ